MKSILFVIIGLVITSVVVFLCLCFCILAGKSDDFWDEIKLNMEKKNDRK